jgi:hypothetical protein
MEEQLYRLVYLSRNNIEGDDKTMSAEVEKILSKSRKNNISAGVTGALMFNKDCFAQVLEGKYDDVQDTFERIQCDLRHDDVALLSFDEAPDRAFSSWSMGYFGSDSPALEKFNSLTALSDFNPESLNGDEVFGLLKEHLFEEAAA